VITISQNLHVWVATDETGTDAKSPVEPAERSGRRCLLVLLEAWGVDALAWFESGRIGASLVSEFSVVAIAIAIALAVWETCNGAMERQLARLAREGHYMRAARLRTLLPMLQS